MFSECYFHLQPEGALLCHHVTGIAHQCKNSSSHVHFTQQLSQSEGSFSLSPASGIISDM